MMTVIPRKTLIVWLIFSKFGCCKPTTFPKKLLHSLFFSEFGEFFYNWHKKQLLVNSSENISKKVKQVLQGELEGHELQ